MTVRVPYVAGPPAVARELLRLRLRYARFASDASASPRDDGDFWLTFRCAQARAEMASYVAKIAVEDVPDVLHLLADRERVRISWRENGDDAS